MWNQGTLCFENKILDLTFLFRFCSQSLVWEQNPGFYDFISILLSIFGLRTKSWIWLFYFDFVLNLWFENKILDFTFIFRFCSQSTNRHSDDGQSLKELEGQPTETRRLFNQSQPRVLWPAAGFRQNHETAQQPSAFLSYPVRWAFTVSDCGAPFHPSTVAWSVMNMLHNDPYTWLWLHWLARRWIFAPSSGIDCLHNTSICLLSPSWKLTLNKTLIGW